MRTDVSATANRLATLYTWEHNGYDDSDFYAVVWDRADGIIRNVLTGSTRWAGGIRSFPSCTDEDELYAAERQLARVMFKALRDAEHRDHFTPDDAERGQELELLVDGKWSDRITGTVHQYRAGDVGVVFWCHAYGTFYRKGYNKPGRDNRRVGLNFDDGRKIFVMLKKCKKPGEPMSDFTLMKRARILARGRDWFSVRRMVPREWVDEKAEQA